jgi:lysozyme family protein
MLMIQKSNDMADFNKYVPLLKRIEGYGKFTDRKDDRGGPTMSGVTLKTFRRFLGTGKTVNDLKSMSEAQWIYIMKSYFWDRVGADDMMNQSIATIIADWCVNSGTSIIRKVQSIVGVAVDGVSGPITVRAINSSDQYLLWHKLYNARVDFYKRIVAADSSQEKNLKGWLNRLKVLKFTV